MILDTAVQAAWVQMKNLLGKKEDNITVEEAWEQMNGLVGRQFYATAVPIWKNRVFHFLHNKGYKEYYILTPEEIVSYEIPLRIGTKEINPDPARKEAIDVLLTKKYSNSDVCDNQPRYCLVSCQANNNEIRIWIDYAYLNPLSPATEDPMHNPMHIVGDLVNFLKKIPVVYFVHGIHSTNSLVYEGNPEPLLNRMKEAGLKLPKIP
jgi:hypothetical protein